MYKDMLGRGFFICFIFIGVGWSRPGIILFINNKKDFVMKQSLVNRINAVNTMLAIVKQSKVESYAGRIIIPISEAFALKQIDQLFGLGWLVVSNVDTRYFKQGKFSDPYTAKLYKAVFLCPSEDTEYSFENLPFYLACGFSYPKDGKAVIQVDSIPG